MTADKLISSYEKLPPFDKSILQILSIAYHPLNQTQLRKCLIQADIKTVDGKGFDSVTRNGAFKLLRPTLNMLLEKDYLEGKTRSRLLVDRRIVEIVTRQAIAAKMFRPYLEAVQTTLHLTEETLGTNSPLKQDHLIAAIRILFYQKKMDQIKSIYRTYNKRIDYVDSLSAILGEISCNPFDITWVQLLPADVHTELFHQPLIDDLIYWQNKAEHFDYVEQLVLSDSDRCEAPLQSVVLEKWMLTGKNNLIKNWLKNHQTDNTENSVCLRGWMAFLQGKNKKAIQYYETAYKDLNKSAKKRKSFFNNFMGVFYILALMKENKTKGLEQAHNHLSVAMSGNYLFSDIYKLLNYSLQFLTGNYKAANDVFIDTYVVYFYSSTYERDTEFIELFFKLFTYYWIDKEKAKESLTSIKEIYKSSEIKSYPWFKHELAGLINALSGNGKKTTHKPESKCLMNVVQQTKIWEHTLNALLALKDRRRAKPEQVDHDFRMVWFLDYQNNGYCSVRPREQKRKPNGRWTKGRPIALKRLNYELESFPYLTPQDKQICSHVYEHQYKDGWYTNVEYIFDEKYLSAVIGHPLIFLQDGVSRVGLVKGKPELRITKQKNKQISLALSPEPSLENDENYQAVKETETRIKLVAIDDEYQRMAELLGKGIQVPASAKNKVRRIIEKFASDITIHSDIGGKGEQLVETEADSKLHVHLIPFGNGLKISLFVRPFGMGGAYYSPGSGGRNVIAEINGKQLQTTRDLVGEKKKMAELVDRCPTLQRYDENQGEWLLDEIGDSLEVLLELDELRQQIVLEWPEGEKFKMAGQASLNQLHLGIKQQQDWFAVNGKLVIDKQLVVDMEQLLALTEKSQSRFIELKEGQFIALTNEFRKRLQELNRYSEKYGKSTRFHPLAALALEALTNGVGQLKTDMAWKSHVKKLQSAQDFTPRLPSTLQAELRDYQLQGFQWLATLSHWGVGACLADDMGLGKTLQALAMLLKHAPNGPSLVVAPTSVCMNWLAETKRFAPTLNMVQLGGANREKVLNGAGKFDVILCSYGLLQQDRAGEMLAVVPWQMVVLDEAQAIKNVFTKRSQAAMKLQARFRLLTTGTPIENHLGELWNLFHFINPGLLSSLDSFNKNFAVPIEKYKDRQARSHLQKLIQPFILRRTKSQVLEELPARTEIRLSVELSMEETAFYEALRRRAVEQLSELDEKSGGKKYLKILGEIMKLRRACCNTVLVDEEISLPSSKLAMFGEVLRELLENRHKALVFSQFVGHLSLIRAYLDEQNIQYQYLDGSTPVKQRKIAVDAFQAGEGDVFLISLRAGGLGLNLTAADYVIHMDPWWNPAVEDQASDRAHRIGQQRPVTIYRLVAKDTIEEKIAQMHNRKRDLAEGLLQGSDISGKISGEELLALITNQLPCFEKKLSFIYQKTNRNGVNVAQLEHIEAIEKRLWGAADTLRANSNYASNEYFLPVMGLVFLRHAYSRFLAVKDKIEGNLPTRGGKTRALSKEDFSQQSSIFLQPEAQFDSLVALPDSEDRAKAIIKAMESIEADYENLRGILPKSEYQELDNDVLGQLLRTLNPDVLKKVSGDVFGRIYEYFLTQFADQKAHDGGEFFTPVSLVSLIAHVLDPEHGTVLDPACGSGGMFVQSARIVEEHGQSPSERLTFRGLEKNAATIRLAKMNLAVHGLEGDIQKAITYYEDPHDLVGKSDFVMANPPFNVDEIDADKVKTDPRLPFGLPGVNKKGKVSNGNYVWVSYFYSYLNERGRAGFVMSSQASSAGGGEAKVRRKLVESGDVDVMAAIRSNFFYTRTVPCELWFLNRDKPDAHRDKVLMIDARNVYRKVTRKIYDFSPEQRQNLLAIVWLYRGQTDRYLKLVSGYCRRTLNEGSGCFKTKDDNGDAIWPLSDFAASLKTLTDTIKTFTNTLSADAAHASIQMELTEALPAFQADVAGLKKALAEQEGAWKKQKTTNGALKKAVDRLAPLAETSRNLVKQSDLLYKLATRLIESCEKECSAKKSDAWNARDITRMRKTADESRQLAVAQLKQVRYFWKQALWLTERFPEARLSDVEGLVKLVDIEVIEANEWSLTPGRYVGVAPEEEDENFDFEETLREIHVELEELNAEAVTLAATIKKNFEELGA